MEGPGASKGSRGCTRLRSAACVPPKASSRKSRPILEAHSDAYLPRLIFQPAEVFAHTPCRVLPSARSSAGDLDVPLGWAYGALKHKRRAQHPLTRAIRVSRRTTFGTPEPTGRGGGPPGGCLPVWVGGGSDGSRSAPAGTGCRLARCVPPVVRVGLHRLQRWPPSLAADAVHE